MAAPRTSKFRRFLRRTRGLPREALTSRSAQRFGGFMTKAGKFAGKQLIRNIDEQLSGGLSYGLVGKMRQRGQARVPRPGQARRVEARTGLGGIKEGLGKAREIGGYVSTGRRLLQTARMAKAGATGVRGLATLAPTAGYIAARELAFRPWYEGRQKTARQLREAPGPAPAGTGRQSFSRSFARPTAKSGTISRRPSYSTYGPSKFLPGKTIGKLKGRAETTYGRGRTFGGVREQTIRYTTRKAPTRPTTMLSRTRRGGGGLSIIRGMPKRPRSVTSSTRYLSREQQSAVRESGRLAQARARAYGRA
jgi:hypothetical protein